MTARLDGRAVCGLIALLALGMVLAARVAVPVFLGVGLLMLAMTAYSAHRWPRATLVGASLVTLADPTISPRFFPSSLVGPIGASEPLLAIAGIVVTVSAARRGTLTQAFRDPTFFLAALFVGISLLSALVNSTPPLVALLGIVMTVDALAIFFVWRMLPMSDRDAAWTIGGIVAAGVVAALVGIGQVLLDPNLLGFPSFAGRFGEGARITSFLGNPNMIAPVLGLTLPFALYGGVHLRPRWRWIARAGAFVLLLALVLTFSRGAWGAVGIGLLLGTLLLDRRTFLLLLVLIPLAWATAVIMPRSLLVPVEPNAEPPPIPDWLGSTADRLDGLSGESDLRIRFMQDGLRIIDDNLLLGVGPGRYGGAAASIIPSPVYEEYDAGLHGFRTVHNFWLHMAGEVGAIGVAGFLAMVIALLIRFVRAARAASGTRFVILAGAATATLVVGLNNLTEMLFEGNVPGILIWLMLAIGSLLAPSPALWGRRRDA